MLGIITTNIESNTGDGFVEASEGETLVVGDAVRTDATGFAELTYHDGSWMRVESEATLTIEDLADSEDGQVVSTSIDTGQAWSRVKELSEPDDEFVLDTPVASAGVRGTAFAVGCDGDTECTFSVLEGEVLVTPNVGDPVTLTAGQSLTITAGEEPPAPSQPGVEALEADPFIAKNLELDETKTAEDITGDDENPDDATDDEEASGIDVSGVDVCTLLDDATVAALTGGTAITADGGPGQCFWGSGEPQYVEVFVSGGSATELPELSPGGDCSVESVSGIGDEAQGASCAPDPQTKVILKVLDRGVVVEVLVNEATPPISPTDLVPAARSILDQLG